MKQPSDDSAFGIVRDGYDRIAELYRNEREKFENFKELEEFCSKLPSRAKILDVGCGTGVPRVRHAAIFQSFHTILKPQGAMLVSVGSSEWEEVESYYGVKMFWSHFHPTTTESLITGSGFRVEFGRNVESGDETHYWILARK